MKLSNSPVEKRQVIEISRARRQQMNTLAHGCSPPSNVNNVSTVPPSARSDRQQTELNLPAKETDRTLFANATAAKMQEKLELMNANQASDVGVQDTEL